MASGVVLQDKVNRIFQYPETDMQNFNEFSEESAEELRSLSEELANAGGLVAAIQLAADTITVKKEVPYLVKLVLGVYLTHSKEAHDLGVGPPPIKMHSRFASELSLFERIAPSVGPDKLEGIDKIRYWREDYDLSDHHYHWHNVYPYFGICNKKLKKFERTIVRQGELFMYMHSQMVSRYNAELLSWDVGLVTAWQYHEVPKEGYKPVPGLQSAFCTRPADQGWYPNRNPQNISILGYPPITDMIEYRDNISKAIDDLAFGTKTIFGKKLGTFKVSADNALNWLGVVIESESGYLQEVSPGVCINRDLYKALHNSGHMKFGELGYILGSQYGAISNNIASVRDPLFFNWHRHIDEFRIRIIKKYKHDLDEYKPKARITDIEIVPQNEQSETPKGGITTIIGPPRADLNETSAKLHHEPYEWKVTVKSTRSPPPSPSNPQIFTVRIFIAPVALIDNQSILPWIEMDKFTYTLTKPTDTAVRKDVESAVARKVPEDKDNITNDGMSGGKSHVPAECDCGWPPNLMLPAGTPEGMPFLAFAMLTNDTLVKCGNEAISFCGAKNGKYPDNLGMGYPFDKAWTNAAASVKDSVAGHPHIKLSAFKIYRQNGLQ